MTLGQCFVGDESNTTHVRNDTDTTNYLSLNDGRRLPYVDEVLNYVCVRQSDSIELSANLYCKQYLQTVESSYSNLASTDPALEILCFKDCKLWRPSSTP
jgi:hypothetical protein